MLILLSPAKLMDESPLMPNLDYSLPVFLNEASILVKELRKYSVEKLASLMKINSSLAELNFQRYLTWSSDFNVSNSKPALLMFNGAVYNGLNASSLKKEDLMWINDKLIILSGLYGILRPLDLIKPYRLEMGTRFETASAKNLYAFWGDKITNMLNEILFVHKDKILINLASQEYFNVLDTQAINGKIITPVFKESRPEGFKIITIYAKKARGLMTRYIIENRIKTVDDLKHFDLEGYFYSENMSDDGEIVFIRDRKFPLS